MGIIPILIGVFLLGNSVNQQSSGQAFSAVLIIAVGMILQASFHSRQFQHWIQDLLLSIRN